MLRWLRRRALPLALLAPVLAAAAGLADAFIEDDNFRVVDLGFYRAGQLRSDEWSESLDAHRYRSVLNLRGAAEADWYRLERQFADRNGLVHYDLRMSATQEPGLEDMRRLVALMREAPKPLLVHCKDGADRSGLAAALYLLAIKKRPRAEAEGQLSLWYGHFPWLSSRTGAMDRALAAFPDLDEAAATPPGRWRRDG